jgi:hypothetical protein
MNDSILTTWTNNEPSEPKRNLLEQILVFCRLLRGVNIKTTTTNILDLFQSLNYIDITEKQSFYYAARANLVSSYEDFPVFDNLFVEFWGKSNLSLEPLENVPISNISQTQDVSYPTKVNHSQVPLRSLPEEGWKAESDTTKNTKNPAEESKEDTGTNQSSPGYSPLETLMVKDFGDLEIEEEEWIKHHIQQAIPKLFTLKSRRKKQSSRGTELDFRKTLRRNLKQGGHVVRLIKKQRKLRKNQLLLLCDVSGSMDAYSSFLIQFIYAMQSKLNRIETWVFSTRITRVTEFLKSVDLSSALIRISQKVTDWSGGTDIGGCLFMFNQTMGRRFVNRRTMVILISDGWDRGDTTILGREMQRIKMNAYKVIWLNPLLGLPNYRPINKGMAAALPYIDYFLPAHNLRSLLALGKLIHTLTKKSPREV